MKNSTNSIKRMLVAAVGATSVAATLLIGVAAPANAAVSSSVKPTVKTIVVPENAAAVSWMGPTKVRKMGNTLLYSCVTPDAAFLPDFENRTFGVVSVKKTKVTAYQSGSDLVMKKVKKGAMVCEWTATKRSTEPSTGGSSTNPSGGSSTSPSGGSVQALADEGVLVVPTVTLAKVITRGRTDADTRATGGGLAADVTTVVETTWRLSGGTFAIHNYWTGQMEYAHGEDYFVTQVEAFDGTCKANKQRIDVYPVSDSQNMNRMETLSKPRTVPGYDMTVSSYESCVYGA